MVTRAVSYVCKPVHGLGVAFLKHYNLIVKDRVNLYIYKLSSCYIS